MAVQSIRFNRVKWPDKQEQILWLRRNGYVTNYVGVNPQYKHYDSYRQISPSEFLPGSFRTHKTLNGMLIIYGKLRP